MPDFPNWITLSDAVHDALVTGSTPVVALESTLITHGLPFPDNVETALAMEAAVRDSGALPATIAILNGQITIGITPDDIHMLAAALFVRKCSRRDLAIATARGEHGATTVAATMLLAHRAGIRIFATGGIGGVHRGQPFDVSADLIELGRTPVAVVCSGAKSILDLPLTMEVLETQGVPVIGWGTDTLPAFYSRSSGLPVPVRIDTPVEAAAIIAAAERLKLGHGILITVPVPEADALPEADAERAIATATDEAHAAGITGAKVTPYVLGRVAEITANTSRRANIALLVNNARTAGSIASALLAVGSVTD
jgi:pseudouridine-5'-phosphate glycosidase